MQVHTSVQVNAADMIRRYKSMHCFAGGAQRDSGMVLSMPIPVAAQAALIGHLSDSVTMLQMLEAPICGILHGKVTIKNSCCPVVLKIFEPRFHLYLTDFQLRCR